MNVVLPFLGYLIIQIMVSIVGLNMVLKKSIGKTELLTGWIFGQMLLFAILQVLSVPMILLRWRFDVLFWSFMAITFVLFCAGIRKIKNIRLSMPKLSPIALFLAMVSALLILSQACTYFFGYRLDEDDARWLAEANDILEYGDMMTRNFNTGEYVGWFVQIKDVTSPWPVLFAVLSRVLFTRVSVVAHTIYPTEEIILVYGIYLLIATELLQKRESKLLFLLLSVLLTALFGGSAYTQGAFSLVRIWQGKASVAAVITPMLLYLFICINKRNLISDWLKVAMVGCAACMMSGMGISISLIMIGVYGAYNIIAYQRWQRILLYLVSIFPSLTFALTYYYLKG